MKTTETTNMTPTATDTSSRGGTYSITMDPIRARISSPRIAADRGYLTRILPAGFIVLPSLPPMFWLSQRLLRPVAADGAIAKS